MFLVAPSSTDQRVAKIVAACRGFVYAASLMGITGTRNAVSSDAAGLVKRIREHTDLPVAVGLGVSNGTQAAQVAGFADGVIVGSAFVRRLLEAASRDRRDSRDHRAHHGACRGSTPNSARIAVLATAGPG